MKRVVVTGIGAVTPVGNDIGSMWDSLKNGRHGIDRITKFDTTEFKTKLAAEVKGFDPLQYMEKTEARRNDLFSQYATAAAVQAMEDSGLEGTVADERLGVYMGFGVGGIDTFSKEMEKLFTKGPRRVSPLFIPMIIGNIAGGNIAIRFHAKGPCLPVVTACATGSNAIGEAFRAIKHGYADAIIAGGAEAAISPIGIAGFANMMALSPAENKDEACLPFDARRKGFVMGEGAGALILEEYGHAKARGAKIYGEIAGYGVNCDAYHITAPDPEATGGANAIVAALAEGGIAKTEKIYMNAHGTGTKLNDAAETKAVKQAFGCTDHVIISSTKSMTGHMLGAAGAVEAIASLLALQTGVIPPTVGLLEADPECDLDYVPQTARKEAVNCAISLSLGFGGHNACVAFIKEDRE